MAESPILKQMVKSVLLSITWEKYLHNLCTSSPVKKVKTQLKCKLSLDNASTIATHEQKAKPGSARN